MKISETGLGAVIRITDDPAENSCKPAVDYLFRSAEETYGGNVLAVVMTGMGDDGSRSVRGLHKRGAHIIAQDEASSTVFGMPRRIIEEGTANVICSLDDIADKITQIVQR